MLGKTSSNVLSVYGQKNFMTVLIINSISEQKQETVDQGRALGCRKKPIRHAHSPVGSVFKL